MLTAFGLPGILVLIPITAWQIADQPGLPLPPLALAALSVLQPLLLLLFGAAAGSLAAPHLGLRSLVAERASGTGMRPGDLNGLGGIALISVLLGIAINFIDDLAQPLWVPAGVEWLSTADSWSPVALLFGVLYGGLTEEIMFRWGGMTTLAWALWRLSGSARPLPRWPFLVAIALSAVLFGAGHLPALAAMLPLSAGPVARTILLNGLAGLWLGWLFWRRHLEAAMLAHTALHFGFAAYAAAMIALT